MKRAFLEVDEQTRDRILHLGVELRKSSKVITIDLLQKPLEKLEKKVKESK